MTHPAENHSPEPTENDSAALDLDSLEFDDVDDLEPGEPVHNDCRCGDCCRHLIIEAELEDAEREPKIKERGDPIYAPAELTASRKPELEGYLLNSPDNDNACAFLNQTTNLCTIYETRPWACRLFDCDGEGKEQLIQLGIRPGAGRSR